MHLVTAGQDTRLAAQVAAVETVIRIAEHRAEMSFSRAFDGSPLFRFVAIDDLRAALDQAPAQTATGETAAAAAGKE